MEKIMNYKFILLGDSSVGKTSIFQRLQGHKFRENTLPTVGIDNYMIKYNKLKVEYRDEEYIKDFNISLYDTAGQERYRAFTPSYYRGADGIILIYDITDRTSYEHTGIWLQNIRDFISNLKYSGYTIMLLGNKLDIAEDDSNKRKVNKEEAENLCRKNGIYFGGEFSAKKFSNEQIQKIIEDFLKITFSKLGISINKKQKVIKKVSSYKRKKSKFSCFY